MQPAAMTQYRHCAIDEVDEAQPGGVNKGDAGLGDGRGEMDRMTNFRSIQHPVGWIGCLPLIARYI